MSCFRGTRNRCVFLYLCYVPNVKVLAPWKHGIKLGGGDPGQIYNAWTNVASDGSLLRLEPRFWLPSILIAVPGSACSLALHPYSITAQDGYTGLQFTGVYISAFICWLLAARWRPTSAHSCTGSFVSVFRSA
jgi:hypothetical protein